MIFLKNDYSIGAHPDVLNELIENNLKYHNSYGNDERCAKFQDELREKLGQPGADVHLIVGGTLTNLTCLSAFLKPYEAVITTTEGHIAVHETGAVEATGHRLLEIRTQDGKLPVGAIEPIMRAHADNDQMVVPKLVYISNTTEPGSVYTKAEIKALRDECDKYGMYLYMDGARLGMALGAEKNDMTLADIAELTDAFYIGGNKCGAMFGECVVITNDKLKDHFRYHMRQHGALMSKAFLIGMQFEVLMKDGLYEELGRHCNEMGKKLAEGLTAKGYELAYEPESNMIFPVFPAEQADRLVDDVAFEMWEDRGDTKVIRLVASWATREEEIEEFLKLV